MPLTTTKANALTTAINEAFDAIGRAGDTAMPRVRGSKNTEPTAFEYLVSSLLLRISESRREKARGAALKAGILFDPEKQPLTIGTTNAVVYSGEVVEIVVSVTNPTSRLDQPELVAGLEKAGVKLAVINKQVLKATHENRAPHRFTATLCTSR